MNEDITKKEDEFAQEYITFVVHTAKYKTLPTKKYLQRKHWVPVNENLIYSKIPGLIFKLFVNVGDKVNKGDILLELEAMKMLNKIICPFDATIKKIHVTEKVRVGKNVLLIELSEIKQKKKPTKEVVK